MTAARFVFVLGSHFSRFAPHLLNGNNISLCNLKSKRNFNYGIIFVQFNNQII